MINRVFPFKHDKRDLKAINYFYCTEQLLISGNMFKQFISNQRRKEHSNVFYAHNIAGIKNLCHTVQVLQLTIGEKKEVIPE